MNREGQTFDVLYNPGGGGSHHDVEVFSEATLRDPVEERVDFVFPFEAPALRLPPRDHPEVPTAGTAAGVSQDVLIKRVLGVLESLRYVDLGSLCIVGSLPTSSLHCWCLHDQG